MAPSTVAEGMLGAAKRARIGHATTFLLPEMGLIRAAAPHLPRSVPAPAQRLVRHALVPRDDHAMISPP